MKQRKSHRFLPVAIFFVGLLFSTCKTNGRSEVKKFDPAREIDHWYTGYAPTNDLKAWIGTNESFARFGEKVRVEILMQNVPDLRGESCFVWQDFVIVGGEEGQTSFNFNHMARTCRGRGTITFDGGRSRPFMTIRNNQNETCVRLSQSPGPLVDICEGTKRVGA